MSRTACGLVAAALFAATSLAATCFATDPAFAQTPSWTPPPDSQRCPSKWGAGVSSSGFRSLPSAFVVHTRLDSVAPSRAVNSTLRTIP